MDFVVKFFINLMKTGGTLWGALLPLKKKKTLLIGLIVRQSLGYLIPDFNVSLNNLEINLLTLIKEFCVY